MPTPVMKPVSVTALADIQPLPPGERALCLREIRVRHFVRVLMSNELNVSKTSRALKIERESAYQYLQMLKKLGLDVFKIKKLPRKKRVPALQEAIKNLVL